MSRLGQSQTNQRVEGESIANRDGGNALPAAATGAGAGSIAGGRYEWSEAGGLLLWNWGGTHSSLEWARASAAGIGFPRGRKCFRCGTAPADPASSTGIQQEYKTLATPGCPGVKFAGWVLLPRCPQCASRQDEIDRRFDQRRLADAGRTMLVGAVVAAICVGLMFLVGTIPAHVDPLYGLYAGIPLGLIVAFVYWLGLEDRTNALVSAEYKRVGFVATFVVKSHPACHEWWIKTDELAKK